MRNILIFIIPVIGILSVLTENGLCTTNKNPTHRSSTLASTYFEVSYVQPDDRILALETAKRADKILKKLQSLFHLPSSLFTKKIKVQFLPDLDSFSQASGLPLSAITQSGTIAVSRHDRIIMSSPKLYIFGYNFLKIFTHELINHLLKFKCQDFLPLWLREGLATYYEVSWDDLKPGQVSLSVKSILAKADKNNSFIELAKMPSSFAYLTGQDALTATAQTYTMTKFLLSKYPKKNLDALLALKQDSKDFNKAFKFTYKITPSQFVKKWRHWLKKQQWQILESVADLTPTLTATNKSTKLSSEQKLQQKISEFNKFKLLGNLLFDKGRSYASRIEFKKAYDKSPLNLGLNKKLALLFIQTNEPTQAITLLKDALVQFPEDAYIHYLMGTAKYKTNDLTSAKRYLYTAFLTNPFNKETIEALLTILQKDKAGHDFFDLKAHYNLLIGV